MAGAAISTSELVTRCPPSRPGSAVLCLTPVLGVSLGGGSGRFLERLECFGHEEGYSILRVNERDGLTPAFISSSVVACLACLCLVMPRGW